MDKETAIELEHLVMGIEQALSVLAATISEKSDAAALVKHMLGISNPFCTADTAPSQYCKFPRFLLR